MLLLLVSRRASISLAAVALSCILTAYFLSGSNMDLASKFSIYGTTLIAFFSGSVLVFYR